MKIYDTGSVGLHFRIDGPDDGAPVVFANSLGTDLRLWDGVLPYLPDGLRILRYDKRGHGLSACPTPPYSMGALVSDVEALMDAQGFKNAMFVGLSIGGMIAQGLAVKRLDLVRALVLSNTGVKIGTKSLWEDRISQIKEGGIEALADGVMARWFSKAFCATQELSIWRNMLARQPAAGYIGCAAAISGTDFFSTTSSLRLPALGISGTEDGSTPPDLVRETVDLIPGSKFHLVRGAGHLPCVEKPEEFAAVLIQFMRETGHI